MAAPRQPVVARVAGWVHIGISTSSLRRIAGLMTAQCRPAETALLTRDVFALLDAPAQSVGDIGSLQGQRAMSSAAAHPYGLACDLKGTPAKSPQDAR